MSESETGENLEKRTKEEKLSFSHILSEKSFLLRFVVVVVFSILFFAFFWIQYSNWREDPFAEYDLWMMYHFSFYRSGLIKPLLFWEYLKTSPLPEGTTYYQPLIDIVCSCFIKVFGTWGMPLYVWIFSQHCANAILLYALVILLTGRRMLAILSTSIFLFHPINLKTFSRESSLIWGFEHPMVAFFSLISMYLFVRYLKSEDRRFYLGSLFSFFCACLTKISAVALVPAFISLDWFFFRPQFRASRKGTLATMIDWIEKYFPFILLALLFSIIGLQMFPIGISPRLWGSKTVGILPLFRFFEFTTGLIFPPFFSLEKPVHLVFLTFILGTIFTFWKSPLMRFCLFWVVGSVLPFMFADFPNVPASSRYLYLSSIPFSIGISHAFLSIINWARSRLAYAHGT